MLDYASVDSVRRCRTVEVSRCGSIRDVEVCEDIEVCEDRKITA